MASVALLRTHTAGSLGRRLAVLSWHRHSDQPRQRAHLVPIAILAAFPHKHFPVPLQHLLSAVRPLQRPLMVRGERGKKKPIELRIYAANCYALADRDKHLAAERLTEKFGEAAAARFCT